MFERLMQNLFVMYPAGQSSNCFLLTGERNTLIDTGLKENASIIEKALKEQGLAPKDISLILHTHGHSDHFAADYIFEEAEVMMSEHDGEYVNNKDSIFTASAFFNNDYYPKIDPFLKDGQIVNLEPFSLTVIATPGHTKGSLCFYDRKNKLLFSGDTLYNRGIGNYILLSSNKQELAESIEKLSGLDIEMLLPSHGPILKGNQKENFEFALNMLL